MIAIEDGDLDEPRHGAGCGVADGNGFHHVVALDHGAHAVEELGGIDLRAVTMQGAFNEDHDSCRTRKKNDPEHRAAVGQ